MTPEKLAEYLEKEPGSGRVTAYLDDAAAELRRLAAENESAHIVGIRQEGEIMALEAKNEALREMLKRCASVLFDSRHGEPCNRKEVRDLSAAIDAAMQKETP